MPITVSGTSITFNDSTTQTTAFTGGSYAGPNFQAFTSGGTFTVPSGVTRLEVYVWAGGGGGGGGAGGCSLGSSGGMCGFGGAFITGLTPGATISVTIGGGGNGAAGTSAGATGGTSSFGSYITCTGGSGGPSYTTGSVAVTGSTTVSGATLRLKNGTTTGGSNVSAYWGGAFPGTAGIAGGGGGGFGGGGGGGAFTGSTPPGGAANGPGVNGSNGGSAGGGAGGGNGTASNGGTGAAGTGGGGGGGGGYVLVTW